MTAPLRYVKPAISYTFAEAAHAVGVGETKIREAEKAGDLTFRWIGSRAVVLADDLAAWVSSFPTERVA